VWNLFAQVDAPQSCVQISVSFQDLFSNAVENSNAVDFKSDKHPSLHSYPTAMSGLFAMAGETCATEAAARSSGISNDAVLVESIVAPFDNLIRKGLIYIFLLRQGALLNKKCPVQPESTIAVS
jgi:hypothetical protein